MPLARSNEKDIEVALNAAHDAKEAWGQTDVTERANLLLKMADIMEAHQEIINGTPIRETMAVDIPLAIDHLRYFSSCILAQEGSLSQIKQNSIAYHFYEPLGVIGQIIPFTLELSGKSPHIFFESVLRQFL